jgi:hypothetical protein
VTDVGAANKRLPAYPGIAISRGESFVPIGSLDAIAAPTFRGLRFYRDLHIFDSSGALWQVELLGLEKVGLFHRVFTSTVRARLRVGEPRGDALRTAAEWLCELVDADLDDVYEQHISHQALKARFRACESPRDLIHCATTLGGG